MKILCIIAGLIVLFWLIATARVFWWVIYMDIKDIIKAWLTESSGGSKRKGTGC